MNEEDVIQVILHLDTRSQTTHASYSAMNRDARKPERGLRLATNKEFIFTDLSAEEESSSGVRETQITHQGPPGLGPERG